MKERKTLKEIYSQHEYAILNTLFVIDVIGLFFDGYLIAWDVMMKPLNECIFMGILFVLVGILIASVGVIIYKKIKKSSKK